jgi:hypothetical protein
MKILHFFNLLYIINILLIIMEISKNHTNKIYYFEQAITYF